MRAAHLQAIEKMELKNDPAAFKRYAEKIQTHLFDLSRIIDTFPRIKLKRSVLGFSFPID